jgi:hypothetical protein
MGAGDAAGSCDKRPASLPDDPDRARVELSWADARWSTDLEMGRPSRPADTYT